MPQLSQTPKGISQLAGLVIVLVIAMLGVGGWYVYDRGQKTDENANAVVNQNTNGAANLNSETNLNTNSGQNSNVNSVTNTNTNVNTTVWNTYSNNVYGYSVRVPIDWGFISEFDGAFIPLNTEEEHTAESYLFGRNDGLVRIQVSLSQNETIDEYVQRNRYYQTSTGEQELIIETMDTTLASGLPAVKVTYDSTVTGYDTAYLVGIGSDVLILALHVADDETLAVVNSLSLD